jgi:hypothetical protein
MVWEPPENSDVGLQPSYVTLWVGDGASFQLAITPSGPGIAHCMGPMPLPGLTWSTFGLVSGLQSGPVLCGETTSISFANFLQVRSVRPGSADVTATVEQGSPGRVSSLRVLPTSAISRSKQGPSRLEVKVTASKPTIGAGEVEARLRVVVKLDGRSTNHASVTVRRIASDGGMGPLTRPSEEGGALVADVRWPESQAGRFMVDVTTTTARHLQFVEVHPSASKWPVEYPVGLVLTASGALILTASWLTKKLLVLRRQI